MKNLIISIFVIISTTMCAQAYKNVDAATFKSLIEKNDGLLLDVRTKGEFDRGYIPSAKLIDLRSSEGQTQIASLPKNTPLYIYCYSGARSRSAAAYLSSNGFTNVYNLSQGIIEWNGKGYALITDATAAKPQPDAMSIDGFSQLINTNALVFIDFYAPWCAPCKQMMPMVDELKNEYAGKLKIVKINSDASAELMKKQAITGVPYLVLYKSGKIVYSKYGTVEKTELKKRFNENLKN